MELFIILLKGLSLLIRVLLMIIGLALLIGLLLMIKGLASVSVFIYLQFFPFPEEGSQEVEEDFSPIENN